MCSRAFEILGLEPMYIDPGCPMLPSAHVLDVVLLSREWSIDLRHAAIQARRAGIPIIYLMDGVLEWAYLWQNWGFVKPEGTVLQPLIATDICVAGQHQARILADLGLADRIHVVGLPRLDGIRRQRLIEHDQPRRIIVATAKTFGHNTAHKVYVRAALRDLKDWFTHHPELTPVWRINEGLAAELEVVPSMSDAATDTIQSVSAVVSFTSTVLLEAMLLGVPTAQIDYRAVPQYVQTAWEIRCAEHIESVIQELLFPPPEKLALQEAYLRDELELGEASARLGSVIRCVAGGNRTETPFAATARLTTGQIDFRQIQSHVSAFSVSPITRLQYELDSTYKLWERDQQRLREMQNEIDNLRRDRWITILTKLGSFPGFRKTARLLNRIIEPD